MMTPSCIICAIFIGIVIILAIVLAIKSNLVRDDVDDAAFIAAVKALKPNITDTELSKERHPYSLSRTQILVWTIVISASYLYIHFVAGGTCGNETGLNTTALALMGISAATAAAGAAIDSSQSSQPRHQNYPSEGFFKDILSDDNGINIHRFQNVLWTVICIGIYLYKVLHTTNCTMPDLDNTLIALTGLSSATYVTVKIRENQ
jgi:hypothetical protein